MSTLTERYVWGVLRAIPAAQRADLEPEIRALVADAVEARTGDRAAAEDAERAALGELGDPELLAARYTDRTMVLIGPRWFPEWKRLVTLLLPIVVPIVMAVTTGAAYVAGKPAGELVGTAITTGLGVAVQLVFWVTLVFAVLERAGDVPAGGTWTPDRLPELPDRSRPNAVEVVFSVLALVFLAGGLLWQQAARPITVDGASFALFDPGLWSFWLPYFLVLLGLEIVLTLARWARGGWTWTLAVVNVVLNVAFAGPAIWLLQEGRLLDPGLEAAFQRLGAAEHVATTGTVGVVVILAVGAWDTVDGFRQAARTVRA